MMLKLWPTCVQLIITDVGELVVGAGHNDRVASVGGFRQTQLATEEGRFNASLAVLGTLGCAACCCCLSTLITEMSVCGDDIMGEVSESVNRHKTAVACSVYLGTMLTKLGVCNAMKMF